MICCNIFPAIWNRKTSVTTRVIQKLFSSFLQLSFVLHGISKIVSNSCSTHLTNSLNNKGYKSQGPADLNSSFFPNHLAVFFLNPFLKPITSPGLLPVLFPSLHSNLHFPSPHLFLSVLPWPAAPTTPLDLLRYFFSPADCCAFFCDTILSFYSSCFFLHFVVCTFPF